MLGKVTNFAVIFACLFAGLLCRRSSRFPPSTAQALNSFVIHLSFPALILEQFPLLLGSTRWSPALLVPVSMAWILFGLSTLFFFKLGTRLGWSRPKIGALVLTAGLGNTSFVGFPLLEALMGPSAVRVGILADQPGSFLVLSTAGIAAAAFFAGGSVTPSAILKRVFSFPPFLAMLTASLWFVFGMPGYVALSPALGKVASTLVPLALFAVGYQLKVGPSVLKRRWRPLAWGLGFKLVFAPFFFLILYVGIFGQRDFAAQVTILEAAMATMITSAVVAGEFELDSELANLMVGVSIPLSFLTVPLWHLLLQHLSQ
jgi:predicted permease